MADALKKANEVRAKNLAKKQTDEAKKQTDEAKDKRIGWKKARVPEQEETRLWSRRQTIQHTYGSDENEEITDEDDAELPKGSTTQHGSKSVSSARCRSKCKCGSTEHKNTNHHNCPLNKNKRAEVDTDTVTTDGSTTNTINKDPSEEEIQRLCTCGSETATHRRSCPLNPRNLVQDK